MLVFEFKAYGKSAQLVAIDDAIRTAKFIRNRCIRLWIDVKGTGKNDLQKYWYQFRVWIEYFGKVFKRVTVAVNPQYSSLECSSCGEVVKKTLSTRTHVCKCGCVMDRDENAARIILSRGLGTAGIRSPLH